MTMKFIFIPALCLSLLLTSFSASPHHIQNDTWLTNIGQSVPSFKFQKKNAGPTAIETYKGKVVLLNFFATWCPPCRQELPRVQSELWDVHGNNPAFEILVLAREEGWDKLDPFIEDQGYTFPIVPDLEREVFSKFAAQSIPRNVVLNRNGKIIYQSIGYSQEEFNSMVDLIEQELAKE